jgi:hypothetical protein
MRSKLIKTISLRKAHVQSPNRLYPYPLCSMQIVNINITFKHSSIALDYIMENAFLSEIFYLSPF